MATNGTAFRYKPLTALGLPTTASPTPPSAGLQSILAALHDAAPCTSTPIHIEDTATEVQSVTTTGHRNGTVIPMPQLPNDRLTDFDQASDDSFVPLDAGTDASPPRTAATPPPPVPASPPWAHVAASSGILSHLLQLHNGTTQCRRTIHISAATTMMIHHHQSS